jgi:hypothetical protein
MNETAYLSILERLGVEPPPAHPQNIARLVAMTLDAFAIEGQPIEVRVPWWPQTLFFAPTLRDAEALCAGGVAQARVWTARELRALLGASSLTTDALLTVMQARKAFNGKVIEVRRGGRA